MHDPFTRPDAAGMADMLTDGAVRVLRKRGLLEFSVAALAREVDMSPQALNERLRDKYCARRRALRLVVQTFGRRWITWLEVPLAASPPEIRMPVDQSEVEGVRIWRAFGELARGEAHMGNNELVEVIGLIRDQELGAVQDAFLRWAGGRARSTETFALLAFADGLRGELAVPRPWLRTDEAERAIAHSVADLGDRIRRRVQDRPASA
jgi:AcrR family transcriptional regulator